MAGVHAPDDFATVEVGVADDVINAPAARFVVTWEDESGTERRVLSRRKVRDALVAAGKAASIRSTRKMELAFAYSAASDRVWLADHHHEIVETMEFEQAESLIVGYLRDEDAYFCAPWNDSLPDEQQRRIAELFSRAAESKPPPAAERPTDS